jgi:hypothetical protein
MTTHSSSQARQEAFRTLLVSHVETDAHAGAPKKSSSKWLPVTLVTVGIVIIGSLALGNLNGHESDMPLATAAPVAVNPPYAFGDETIASDPAELAAGAQLVVVGTVIGVEETQAPAEVPQPYGVVKTFTLVLSADQTIQGTAEPGTDGFLRIVIPSFATSAGGLSVDEYLQRIPLGSEVAAYLERAWPASGGMVNTNPEYAATDQFPLYIPTTSQSLAVQVNEDSTVFWPLTGTSKEGTIRDALPGGTLVPLAGD